MNDRDQAERDSLCFVLALGGGGGGGLELHVSRVGILGASANILTENVKRETEERAPHILSSAPPLSDYPSRLPSPPPSKFQCTTSRST